MTDAANNGAATTGAKAYNLSITPLTDVDTTPTSSGTAKTKFRGTFVQRGKTVERTIVAQGKSAALIEGMIAIGTPVALRCVFDRAPSNDNGRGGEFLSVVALPLPPKQKAA